MRVVLKFGRWRGQILHPQAVWREAPAQAACRSGVWHHFCVQSGSIVSSVSTV